jgi:hypothetical protein
MSLLVSNKCPLWVTNSISEYIYCELNVIIRNFLKVVLQESLRYRTDIQIYQQHYRKPWCALENKHTHHITTCSSTARDQSFHTTFIHLYIAFCLPTGHVYVLRPPPSCFSVCRLTYWSWHFARAPSLKVGVDAVLGMLRLMLED